MKFRFQQHYSPSETHCVKLRRAIKKYGKENFTVQFLTVCGTQETADYWETYFIKKFNTIKTGYNLKEGGSHGKMSEVSKNKMRKPKSEQHKKNLKGKNTWSKGIKVSEETKKKIAQGMKGKQNNLGKSASNETKKKMSEKRKGKTWKLIDGKRVWMSKGE